MHFVEFNVESNGTASKALVNMAHVIAFTAIDANSTQLTDISGDTIRITTSFDELKKILGIR